jgi:hypothetical protein
MIRRPASTLAEVAAALGMRVVLEPLEADDRERITGPLLQGPSDPGQASRDDAWHGGHGVSDGLNGRVITPASVASGAGTPQLGPGRAGRHWIASAVRHPVHRHRRLTLMPMSGRWAVTYPWRR